MDKGLTLETSAFQKTMRVTRNGTQKKNTRLNPTADPGVFMKNNDSTRICWMEIDYNQLRATRLVGYFIKCPKGLVSENICGATSVRKTTVVHKGHAAN